jgi:ubiquinone/menaquinone biosynthesis C-methylase UbiE
MQLDTDKLQPLLGILLNDIGGAANAAIVHIGFELGLFDALGTGKPMTPDELAKKTGTHERLVREWLSAQAATGYVTFDNKTGKFSLTAEQHALFADRESPLYQSGAFSCVQTMFDDHARLSSAFKTGKGLGWEQHTGCLYCSIEWVFKPRYKGELIANWLPALDGVVDKLKRGAKVADVGCGHGASTMLMAKAFPKSQFIGIDFHDDSVKHAQSHVNGDKNIRFETARAQDYAGKDFDFVTIFDALHDMGDPVGAAKHIRKSMAPDGTLMIVEPLAGDTLADNLNPVGRMYYAFSTGMCVPSSLNQEVGTALGAQAGEKRLTGVLKQAGFSRVRRAAETPLNMVLEARI